MTRLNKKKQIVWTVSGENVQRKKDILATEEPLEILLRAGQEQKTLAITMRTPGSDYDLAAGFLYNEGIIHDRNEISQMTYCVNGGQQEYNSLRVQLSTNTMPQLQQLERHFFTNSACGICGSTMLDDLEKRGLPPISSGIFADSVLITSLPSKLRQAQELFDRTGGLHAAALFDLSGNLLVVREDVGRHNALDKLIGWGLLNGKIPFHDKILMVSGRASYELLQKCFSAGVPIFCAVSAPSSLAVEVAERFGITLIGFLRENHFNVYTGIERIRSAEKILAS